MRREKGFTLIELLVVIAIIGILSAVVLASLNTARGKAGNATVKAELSSARSQADIYRDNNSGTYYVDETNSVCLDTKIDDMLDKAANVAGAASYFCYAAESGDSYVIAVPLRVPEGPSDTITHWCIDSEGNSKGVTAEPTGTPTVCP